MSNESLNENRKMSHSESHPRLLDIDSSLEKINQIEHTEPHVATFHHERRATVDASLSSDVCTKRFALVFGTK